MFEEIKDKYEEDDRKREDLINRSRAIVKKSKEVITSLHNDQIPDIEGMRNDMQALNRDFGNTRHYHSGSYRIAEQEYVEALAYYSYISEGKLPELDVDYENYLLGICDLTGELVRRAVNRTTKDDFGKVKEIHDFVESIYDELQKMDLRGELRKKTDAVRWNLKKLQEMVFQLKAGGKIE